MFFSEPGLEQTMLPPVEVMGTVKRADMMGVFL